jgi:hypothetical protein
MKKPRSLRLLAVEVAIQETKKDEKIIPEVKNIVIDFLESMERNITRIQN